MEDLRDIKPMLLLPSCKIGVSVYMGMPSSSTQAFSRCSQIEQNSEKSHQNNQIFGNLLCGEKFKKLSITSKR